MGHLQWLPGKDLVTNGTAGRLSVINYAFGNVAPDSSGQVRCASTDPNADYQRPFTAAESVNGRADRPNQQLKGNFNQLRELKARYPGLKVVVSLGGYTLSGHFSDAALTASSRQALVRSCVNMFIKGNLPGLKPGAAAGVFDGIDIDWEYPGTPGAPGNVYRPQDTRNYTLLLAEFQRQLDRAGHGDAHHGYGYCRRHYLLTAAVPAGNQKQKLQISRIHRYLDWLNLMTYDLHGPWEATGPTNFQSNLYTAANDPSPADATFSVDSVVRDYLRGGTPARQIVIGVPFYGHGWTGVPAGKRHGLYQSATGPADPGGGTANYNVLAAIDAPTHRDAVTGGYWKYDGNTFWAYDDPTELYVKMRYVLRMHLGGAMMWSLDGDNAHGSLVRAIDRGLSGR